MKKLICTGALLLIALMGIAQIESGNTAWMEYLEELSETESGSLEDLYDELSYLSEHPFNIHTVTKNELNQLPFLSEIQIENVLYYVYKYGPLVSLYELRNVEGLDMQTIMRLLPFVYIGEPEGSKEKLAPRKILRSGRQELILRADYTFQQKAGYERVSDEEREAGPGKYYVGENYYLSFKYGFQYKDKIQFGWTGEKDKGEAFWNHYHKGFDFYSAHLVLKNIGIMRSLYLGDYRLSFGEGLVLNTDFSMGKTSDVINITKKNAGVKRHYSTGESNFFRGVATQIQLKNTLLTFFYSHREPDANADSATIFGFKTDGYNRTLNDLKKRRQATVNLAGGNVGWQNGTFTAGFTGVYYHFGGKELNPEERLYNLHYFRGKENFNAGVHYGIQRKKFVFRGETGVDRNGKRATVNTLQIDPGSVLGLAFSYRNYDKGYAAQYAGAFGESSSVQNESGFYGGIQLKFLKYWEAAAYVDFFKFPWLRYGIDAPSEGKDALIQLTYKPNSRTNLMIRYKYKEKAKNHTDLDANRVILPGEQHRIRIQLNHQPGKVWAVKTQFDYHLLINPFASRSSGRAFSQSLSYKPQRLPFTCDLGYAYFNTDDWNTRITMYEKNILYSFGFPSLYGEGFRYYSVLKFSLLKDLAFYLKIAGTRYFDRNKIGSGAEEIEGKDVTDLYCLMRLKF